MPQLATKNSSDGKRIAWTTEESDRRSQDRNPRKQCRADAESNQTQMQRGDAVESVAAFRPDATKLTDVVETPEVRNAIEEEPLQAKKLFLAFSEATRVPRTGDEEDDGAPRPSTGR